MPQLVPGRIIWVDLLDQNGVNRKIRPVVILTETPPSQPLLVAVATTTYSRNPLPPYHVELPYNPNRQQNCVTGLREPCAALCSWLESVSEADVQKVGGIVPPQKMKEILKQVDLFRHSRPP